MFLFAEPWWELVLRAVVVYGFLLIMLRLTGKRQVGQLAPFDLVLLLILSNAVQNAINAGDNSLVGGLVSATTLLLLNTLVGYVTYRNARLEAFIDGKPEVLIHNGKLFPRTLAKACMSREELQAALRRAGCATVEEVQLAMLEINGSVSVISQADRERQKTIVPEPGKTAD